MMKKIRVLFLFICFMLSGCELRPMNNVCVEQLQVYEQALYNDDLVLFRSINHYSRILKIHIKDYESDDMKVDVTISDYKNDIVLAENYKEDVFRGNVSVKLKKKGMNLEITEDVSYYDASDKFNNFSYTKNSTLAIGEDNKVIRIREEDMKNKVVTNIIGVIHSMQVGVYDGSVVYYLYNYLMIALIVIFALMILLNMRKHKYLRDWDKPIYWLLDGGICLLMFINIFIDAKEKEAILLTTIAVLLMIRLFVVLYEKKKT